MTVVASAVSVRVVDRARTVGLVAAGVVGVGAFLLVPFIGLIPLPLAALALARFGPDLLAVRAVSVLADGSVVVQRRSGPLRVARADVVRVTDRGRAGGAWIVLRRRRIKLDPRMVGLDEVITALGGLSATSV